MNKKHATSQSTPLDSQPSCHSFNNGDVGGIWGYGNTSIRKTEGLFTFSQVQDISDYAISYNFIYLPVI